MYGYYQPSQPSQPTQPPPPPSQPNICRLQRVFMEAIEVAFIVLNHKKLPYGIDKITDLLYQIIPTAFILNTAYWVFFSSWSSDSLCVCDRYRRSPCRHRLEYTHWLDTTGASTKAPAETVPLVNSASGGKSLSGVPSQPYVYPGANRCGSATIAMPIDILIDFNQIDKFGTLEVYIRFSINLLDMEYHHMPRQVPSDNMYNTYFIKSRFRVSAESYPTPNVISFVPHPSTHFLYGFYVPSLLHDYTYLSPYYGSPHLSFPGELSLNPYELPAFTLFEDEGMTSLDLPYHGNYQPLLIPGSLMARGQQRPPWMQQVEPVGMVGCRMVTPGRSQQAQTKVVLEKSTGSASAKEKKKKLVKSSSVADGQSSKDVKRQEAKNEAIVVAVQSSQATNSEIRKALESVLPKNKTEEKPKSKIGNTTKNKTDMERSPSCINETKLTPPDIDKPSLTKTSKVQKGILFGGFSALPDIIENGNQSYLETPTDSPFYDQDRDDDDDDEDCLVIDEDRIDFDFGIDEEVFKMYEDMDRIIKRPTIEGLSSSTTASRNQVNEQQTSAHSENDASFSQAISSSGENANGIFSYASVLKGTRNE